jgi:hypothetical protein
VRSRLSRRLVQYYTALRLSAGAALLFLPYEPPAERAPIVRQSSMSGPGGFDRREVIERAGRVSVVTLPLSSPRAPSEPTIGLN